MDEATLNQVRTLIKEARARIPALEDEIRRAETAGLDSTAKAARDTLEKSKELLDRLEKAYGK